MCSHKRTEKVEKMRKFMNAYRIHDIVQCSDCGTILSDVATDFIVYDRSKKKHVKRYKLNKLEARTN